MLCGEDNAGERWKTTIGLISKKETLHVQDTFLYISLPLFCTTTMWNFPKLFCYTFFWGNVVHVLVHFFFHCRSFSPCIGAASISHFVTAATKFSCCSSNKKISPLFFFLVELRCLSALYSEFVDMTIDLLSLILYTPRKQKQSPLSVFVVIDS